jgi:hypothetical protein
MLIVESSSFNLEVVQSRIVIGHYKGLKLMISCILCS